MSDRYPLSMTHPSYRPSQIRKVQNGDSYGTPDRFPPITVNNEDQEAQHRALGYLAHGETPRAMIDFSEYPLMLVHPEHVPAVEPETQAKKAENGQIITWTIPGTPEKYPPVIVHSEAEQTKWEAKGYVKPGRSDPEAVQAAIASPHVPGRVTQEWPKLIDGKIVEDPDKPADDRTYPKWLADGGRDADGNPTGKIVNSAAEEKALLAATQPTPPSADRFAKAREAKAAKRAMVAA